MSTGTTLQELARQVRRDTLENLQAARPEWLTFAPSGTSNQTREWPSRDELATLLQQQLLRVLHLLATTSDEQLAEPADLSRGPASVSARIIHGLHDEAKHCGEMYLLLKLCRAGLADSPAT